MARSNGSGLLEEESRRFVDPIPTKSKPIVTLYPKPTRASRTGKLRQRPWGYGKNERFGGRCSGNETGRQLRRPYLKAFQRRYFRRRRREIISLTPKPTVNPIIISSTSNMNRA
jgi:hypothetical protein